MINNKKLCVEISENLGNQMFMYAHAYALSKKLNRELYVDNESAYLRKKSIGSYRLYYFNISSRTLLKLESVEDETALSRARKRIERTYRRLHKR